MNLSSGKKCSLKNALCTMDPVSPSHGTSALIEGALHVIFFFAQLADSVLARICGRSERGRDIKFFLPPAKLTVPSLRIPERKTLRYPAARPRICLGLLTCHFKFRMQDQSLLLSCLENEASNESMYIKQEFACVNFSNILTKNGVHFNARQSVVLYVWIEDCQHCGRTDDAHQCVINDAVSVTVPP